MYVVSDVFLRTDDSRCIEYLVGRKLIELPQEGSPCNDYLSFQSDGIQVGPYHCNKRNPEAWNDHNFYFRAQNFIEIIYQVRRVNGAGGKFWIQIQGNLHLNI